MAKTVTQSVASVETQGHEGAAPGSFTLSTESDLAGKRPLAKLHITYFTDPLCSWSWAFEPQWRRLRSECGEQLAWRYHMGGMISDWQQYSDPLNDISRPIQMGPQWYQVKAVSGMPLEDRLWYEDPPASSYPGCIAVKAAERQAGAAGERYLRLLREAAMLQRRNIARRAVQVELAHELEARLSSFDAAQFAADLEDAQVLNAFRDDIKEVRYRNISRFPTFIVRFSSGPAIMLVGYRPYDALRATLTAFEPTLTFMPAAGDLAGFLRTWGSATVQEVTEMYGLDRQSAAAALERAVETGRAQQQGELYVTA